MREATIVSQRRSFDRRAFALVELVPANVCLLHDVLGVVPRAEHAEGEVHQVPALAEEIAQLVGFHVGHPHIYRGIRS